MNGTKLILLASIASASLLHGAGRIFVVPNELENQEGNDAAFLPFVIGTQFTGTQSTERYQQIFDASQFAAIPPGGAYLSSFWFRSDCSLNNGGVILSNLQMNLSTTQKTPDGLSATFAENTGSDDIKVFGPGQFITSAAGATCPGPDVFDDILDFATPFFYNPAKGNLLMDIRVYPGLFLQNPGFFANDGANTLGDSISRAYASTVDATVATQVDTSGIVTRIRFDPVPSLTNSWASNTFTLTWPTRPTNFRLFASGGLGQTANWQQVPTNQITGNFFFQTLTLPITSLTNSRFFQLRCISCTTNSPFAQARNSVSTELH